MSVIRVKKHEKNFVILYKTILEDPDITLKAKGLWAFCMAKPDDWEFSLKQLQYTLLEGRKALTNAIDELMAHGYCKRIQNKDDQGRWTTVDYEIFELSELKKCSPECPFVRADNRRADKEPQLNTNGTKDRKNNNPQAKEEQQEVVVFSKEAFEKAAKKCGIETERIEKAWKIWYTKSDKGRGMIRDPIAWLIDCARKNYRVPESRITDNINFLKKFEKAAEKCGKSHLIQANEREGYIVFTDCPSVIYNVKDMDFFIDVARQMKNRKISC